MSGSALATCRILSSSFSIAGVRASNCLLRRPSAAIKAKGLTSLEQVRAHTKASASCGTCTHLVEQVMALTLGDAYNPAAVQPMCGGPRSPTTTCGGSSRPRA